MTKLTRRISMFALLAISVISLSLFSGCTFVKDDIPSSTPVSVCDHATTEEQEALPSEGCKHVYNVLCADCGKFLNARTEYEHNWSASPKRYDRESCLVGAYTAVYCLACGEKNENTIKPVDGDDGISYPVHRNSVTITYMVDPKTGKRSDNVCESDKVTVSICTACGQNDIVDKVLAPGHKYANWEITKEPSAEIAGAMSGICSVCDLTKEETLPAIYLDAEGNATATPNEKYTISNTVGASCSKKGRTDTFAFKAPDETVLEFKITVAGKNHYITDGAREVTIDQENVMDYIEGKFVSLNEVDITCGKDGVSATCECEGCENQFTVKVRKAHAEYVDGDDRTIDTKPTCLSEGSFTYNCSACGEELKGNKIDPLGHKFVIDESKGEKGTERIVEEDGTVTYKVYVTCANGCTGDEVDYDNVLTKESFTVVDTPATCSAPQTVVYGKIKVGKDSAILSDDNGSVEIKITIGETTPHILNGEEIICSYDNPYPTEKAGIEFVGTTPYCFKTDKDSKSNGFFKCDKCGIWAPVFVDAEHVRPDDFDESNSEIYKAPTCTGAGFEKYTCKECGESVDKVLKPLGHSYEWNMVEVEGLVVKYEIRCTVCAVDEQYAEITVDFGKYIKDGGEGKIVVADEDALNDGWKIETLCEGTCSAEGTYRVTLTVSGDSYLKSLSFELKAKAEHSLSEDTFTYTGEDGSYDFKYCAECDATVLLSDEEAEG